MINYSHEYKTLVKGTLNLLTWTSFLGYLKKVEIHLHLTKQKMVSDLYV